MITLPSVTLTRDSSPSQREALGKELLTEAFAFSVAVKIHLPIIIGPGWNPALTTKCSVI